MTKNDSQLKTNRKVGLVITTLGLNDFTSTLVTALLENECFVIVIEQSESDELPSLLTQVPNNYLTYSRIQTMRGANCARNLGIQIAPDSCEYLMFLNDTCIPNQNFLNQASILLESMKGVGAVCGNYKYRNGWKTSAVYGRIDNKKAMSVVESAIIFRRRMLEDVGEFGETIGMGSTGIIQSGEGADLLIRSIESGWQVIGVNEYAGTDSRESPSHKLRENFLNGLVFSYTARKHGLLSWAILRIVGPLGCKNFKTTLGDPAVEFRSNLAAVAGRLCGVVVPIRIISKFKREKVSK
jgi:hypothetical protein